ncbi:hypothetical protein [Cellvibrio sp. OA-2007]|uniref:hypothetical protein n=1 Tax=Cellvibrio sp. OA-2007 TaxID=529823 RepID=UPI000AE40C1E|nr:hypothetical protein [Cellvibrio sp. OA-2007]
MFCITRYCQSIPLLALLTIAAVAQADVEHRFSGFATLGLVTSDNPKLAFRRDISQGDGSYDDSLEWRTDSLIGGQWDSSWSSNFDTTVQLVAKDRHENNLNNSVEWAFVRYRPVDGFDLRLGRLGTDIFMLSDYRQVGYAFPWVRPPHDYYTLLSLYHFDGIDLNKRLNLRQGTLNLKVFYGNSDQKFPTGLRSSDTTRLDFDVSGASVVWEQNDWKLRYSYANVAINNNVAQPLIDALDAAVPLWPEAADWAGMTATKGRNFSYHEVGFGYDNNHWWAQAEATQLRSATAIVPQSDHAYLSIGRRFEQFSLYALGGVARPTREATIVTAPAGYPSPIAEQLTQLAAATARNLNGVRIHQKSLGLGVRWDFAAKMALKVQLEEFRIDRQGTNLWLRTQSGQAITENQKSQVTSVSLDVLF